MHVFDNASIHNKNGYKYIHYMSINGCIEVIIVSALHALCTMSVGVMEQALTLIVAVPL